MPTAELQAKTTAERRNIAQKSPEEIFLAWLIWLPKEADMAAAAAQEVRKLDLYRGNLAGPHRLREMFVALIASLAGPARLRN
ncbi:hypothetical protein ATN84_03665 [Paramesorhizobium deserti]|uniref:Uncharacterized protein n=1 Tax=Paramesorhizobium deserti TaxID=1494590 RepID=A0A135I086_9HYPH|nr:hypothetical protein [Paramesorhizobium deserti]KXF78870.1 hypothetical protein ATN84_03665 [Paramesorhizobium deserti]